MLIRVRVVGASLLTACALLMACSGSSTGQSAAGPHQPPPKPGTSISHTQMCSCTRCEPSHCCTGAEDSEAGRCGRDDAAVEGDAYDFTKSEECGIAVASCVGRCQSHVWRINTSETCADTQPEVCCAE